MSILDYLLASPITWGVVAVITAAVALSGRLSMNATKVLLVLAWVIAFVGLLRSESIAKIEWFPRSLLLIFISSGLAFGLYYLAIWCSAIPQSVSEQEILISTPTPSNAELKQEVTKFVSNLYDFNQRMERLKPPDLFMEKGKELHAAKTEKKKMEVMAKYSRLEESVKKEWETQFKNEYDREYYDKAKDLRDKMLKQIPPEKLGRRMNGVYENLAGNSPIRDIASDLVSLSNLLTD